jgi:hypothetical protein
MRNALFVLWMLLCSVTSAFAQVSVGIGLPGVSIGINLPVYPELVPVPGYPVYYAPQVGSNYFFYDGMYWVYQGDNWYASYWYNGPWQLVDPEAVPLFVLRVPVRYYRYPPSYFRGWRSDAPPRWGEHWGNTWEQRHRGWDTWNRSSVPRPAPLPVYQRQYSGDRYPRPDQQQALQSQNYRYQPRDALVKQRYQAQVQSAPASSPPARQGQRPETISPQQNQRGSSQPSPPPQGASPAPRGQAPRAGTDVQRPSAQAPQQSGPTAQPQTQQRQQGAAQYQQQAPRPPGQNRGPQANAPGQEPKAQVQRQQPQQGAVQRQQQAPRPQGQPAQEPKAQPQRQPPQQGSAQREQQAPRPQGQDKGPQGKGPKEPKESKQGQEKEK